MERLLAEQRELLTLANTLDDVCNRVPNSYLIASLRADAYQCLKAVNEAVTAEPADYDADVREAAQGGDNGNS
jgi:hypothetical protein